MDWLKRDIWKASFALAGLLLLLVLMVWVPLSAAGAYERTSRLATAGTGTVPATPTEDATVTALNMDIGFYYFLRGNPLITNSLR